MAINMNTTNQLRTELGDFSSIVCFKALIVGAEEALGEKAAAITMIAAGRSRGRQIAEQLNIKGSNASSEKLVPLLQEALGKNGTRLCIVDNIERTDESITVYCRETVCSAGEPQGSGRKLTFTLGAVQGCLESAFNLRLRGKQIASVLTGSDYDVIQFEVLQ
jgi:hypothetical protein